MTKKNWQAKLWSHSKHSHRMQSDQQTKHQELPFHRVDYGRLGIKKFCRMGCVMRVHMLQLQCTSGQWRAQKLFQSMETRYQHAQDATYFLQLTVKNHQRYVIALSASLGGCPGQRDAKTFGKFLIKVVISTTNSQTEHAQ